MNIYIIAEPPGIGKSTSSYRFVPVGVPIIDQDLAAYQYRKEHFIDYQQLASLSSNQRIKSYLFSKADFALELNLGFQSHYDYLKSIVYFEPNNHVHLILFYTDAIELCLLRADIRYKNGGHLVEASIVKEMYDNTIPLLKQHLSFFKTMTFIDISNTVISEVTQTNLSNWVKDNDLDLYVF